MSKGWLVLNAGSSSIKFALFEDGDTGADPEVRLRGEISGLGREPRFQARAAGADSDLAALDVRGVTSHEDALVRIFDWLDDRYRGTQVSGVGHRVVHGGRNHVAPVVVDPAIVAALEALTPLAPHHQPHNVAAIRAVMHRAPQLPQVACFDTAFHARQPPVARRLPLPREYEARGLLRYGFHGLSYEYIIGALPRYTDGQLPDRVIVAHLGNGASLCAVRDGRAIDTTMGFSTLDGLLMGTRCGTIDPGALLHLMRVDGLGEAELSDLLYNRCGLLGISGISADMRILLESDAPQAREAVAMFCYVLRKQIGALVAALEGLDALVFTGGIGEHAVRVRADVCRALSWTGLRLNEQTNSAGAARISTPESAVGAWVIPTNEELVIARHTRHCITSEGQSRPATASAPIHEGRD